MPSDVSRRFRPTASTRVGAVEQAGVDEGAAQRDVVVGVALEGGVDLGLRVVAADVEPARQPVEDDLALAAAPSAST